MRMQRRTIGLCVFALIAVLAAMRLTGAANRQADVPEGSIQILVMDGRTLSPVQGAVVVVPEAGVRAATKANGRTEILTVPVLPDTRMEHVLEADWGEVTVLVYCPGYYPYALLHCQVRAQTDRTGPTVYLFPDDGSMTEPFSVIESPDPGWVISLLEKYDPNLS